MDIVTEVSEDGRAVTIFGPDGQKLRVRFFPPPRSLAFGKTRFRLYDAAPLHLKEAFMTGQKKNVILTLVPEGWVEADDNGGLVRVKVKNSKLYIE